MVAKKAKLEIDSYQLWLQGRAVKPASRKEGKKVEADTYELWVENRIRKKRGGAKPE